jgi:ubiquinone/menaquinone biosynthesis C-methylase UbiE
VVDMLNNGPTPESNNYDIDYFKNSCGGFDEFNATEGEILPPWTDHALHISNLKPNYKVLDIGTGRGEIAYNSAKKGCLTFGLDYSKASISIAQTLQQKAHQKEINFILILADARNLPLMENTFDVVFMLDIVEHLSQDDLIAVLQQAKNVLNENGRLVIHTMPNLNYYKWGYPIYRVFMNLMGKKLPKDPRKRVYQGETHINIQTPKTLHRNLKIAGFNYISVELTQISGSKIKRFICRVPFIRHILSNDIFAVGGKNEI